MKTLALIPLLVVLLSTTLPASPVATQPAAAWQLILGDDATLTIEHQQDPVVSLRYNFWGQNWKYADAQLKLARSLDGDTTFIGTIPDLGLRLAGRVTHPTPGQIVVTYDLFAARDLHNIIGGGLEFNLKLDAASLAPASVEAPRLLPDNAGWEWTAAPDQPLTVRFDPPLPSMYFERGRTNTLRAFLVGTDLAQGPHRYTMTITLPPGGILGLSPAERYGDPRRASWRAAAMTWNQSPIDLSFLNADERPAGRHGFLTARGDQLVFEDGTPGRFWGANVAAYAVFSDKEQIRTQAHRIAQLGFNLVRIHHHDSTAWVSPTVIRKDAPDSQQLDPAAMDKLDWWIKCLKDEGVYVWLDLHVGRQFKTADAIEGFDELARAGGEAKGFCYFNTRLQELMQAFNRAYLSHVNPYTTLAYKDDPAVVALLLSNENDLTFHFGNRMLPDKNNPYHNRLFTEALDQFCDATGLPRDRTMRTWEPGPSKIFLGNQEHLFNQRLLTDLSHLGVKVPIATTNSWAGMGLAGLPSLTDGGLIDAHSYGEPEALSLNPRFRDTMPAWLAAAHVEGKPLSATEWNIPYPATDRFTAPVYMMSIASLQGFNAMMLYNYSQQPLHAPSGVDSWSTWIDPAVAGLMPAAAIAFRQGHIAPARSHYCLQLPPEQFFNQELNPATSATIRTLTEQSRLTIAIPAVPQLPWLKPTPITSDAQILADPHRDFIPLGQSFVESDTGEIRRDWRAGIQTINTPKTQCASGWVGGQDIALHDVRIQITNPKATIVVTSLDNQPIAQSNRLLITTVARVMPTGQNKLPLMSEVVSGTVTIHCATAGLQVRPLLPDGTLAAAVSPPFRDGQYRIGFPVPGGVHWYLLEGPGGEAK